MEKSHQCTLMDYSVLLFRRMLVSLIIVAIAMLAIFWESLPTSIKGNLTSLSADQSDNDNMVPPKFRIDNQPVIERIEFKLQEPTEYHDGHENHDGLANTAFTQLHEELKKLGATSCRLTYWGDSGNMFRFSCQVQISEQNPSATRTFQSIAPDADQSIREVIEQIRQNL
jgi:hypothetical protein